MYNEKGSKHHYEHIHVYTGDKEAVYNMNGTLMEEQVENSKRKTVRKLIQKNKKAILQQYNNVQNGIAAQKITVR